MWEKSHRLALAVYQATDKLPREETYGLTSQLQRCSVSIPANIAEGCGRSTNADFARFLQISMGSASELEYHLILTHDLKLIDTSEYEQLSRETTEVKRMLTSFISRLKADR